MMSDTDKFCPIIKGKCKQEECYAFVDSWGTLDVVGYYTYCKLLKTRLWRKESK